MLGTTRLHLGASAHYRVNNRDAQNERLRARPLTQITDQRLVDTNAIAADSDVHAGVELAAIHKSLHFAGEFQKIWINTIKPGDTFGPNNGTGGGALLDGNPSFWSAYGEVGFFLTGETRGYKNGLWDRTKVLKPFSKGGWGAFQINGRVDYLDLDSSKLKNALTANYTTGVPTLASTASRLGRGGKQLGFLGSLVWLPEDYFRLYLQYSHAEIEGGPFAATVRPASSKPVDQRKYGVDVIMTRAQIDF
jgi:phosphate-selective porin OprO/OprP